VRGDGEAVRTQPVEGGLLIETTQFAYSVMALRVEHGAEVADDNTLTATATLLENDLVRVELNDEGDIARIYDKSTEREVLAPGAVANQFQAFEDRPKFWDAWDIDIFYDDKQWLAEPATEVRVVETGPLRATIEIKRRILHSTYTQRISLTKDSPRIDIDTTIDWRERHVLLKVAFPVDILAPAATFDIQWGNVQRPTHRNTSWDWARFETCAQKWVDLSEGDYGVSVLNDCKYGHDIAGNVIRISLLRSPTHPDPEADQGEHRFAYSILPHRGGWGETTIGEAYALNDPLIAYDARENTASTPLGEGWTTSLVDFDEPNMVIETVKRAEDGVGLVVRAYESQRRRGPVTLRSDVRLAEAYHTNLLEENGEQLTVVDNAVRFTVRPYQIVTLRLVP
jgi:alpha-mannosidase